MSITGASFLQSRQTVVSGGCGPGTESFALFWLYQHFSLSKPSLVLDTTLERDQCQPNSSLNKEGMALWAKLLLPAEMAQPNVHTRALFACVIKYSLKSLEKLWDQRKADLDLCKQFLASVSSALPLLYWTLLAWSTSLTMRCAFWWLARRMKGLIRSIQGTAIRANMTKKLCTSF